MRRIHNGISLFPREVAEIIVDFCSEYVLKAWIDSARLDWDALSENPNAIDLLRKNSEKINWMRFSGNIRGIELMRENIEKLRWVIVSANVGAVSLLEDYPDRIVWFSMSANSAAVHLLKQNEDKISWLRIGLNAAAIDIIEANLHRIYWDTLSANKNAIHLLKRYPERINLFWLCNNPYSAELAELGPEGIDWTRLSQSADVQRTIRNPRWSRWYWKSERPSIMGIMLRYPGHLDWSAFHKDRNMLLARSECEWCESSENPDIFDLVPPFGLLDTLMESAIIRSRCAADVYIPRCIDISGLMLSLSLGPGQVFVAQDNFESRDRYNQECAHFS